MILFGRAVIEDFLPSTATTSVAHYTRIGTLCHFLPNGGGGWSSARATPVQFLNDRKELTLGLEILKDVASRKPPSGRRVRIILDDLISSFGSVATDAFQMSFSGNPDELGQWRGYGSNGMGCCVVTTVSDIHSVADIAGWVIYKEKEQKAFAYKVLGKLRKVTNDDAIQQILVAAASFMKHEGFEPEMEYRLLKFPDPSDVQFRESNDRLVPFVEVLGAQVLSLEKVIIGPGWQLANLSATELAKHHVAQGIQRLLYARNLHSCGVESSRIPYDPR